MTQLIKGKEVEDHIKKLNNEFQQYKQNKIPLKLNKKVKLTKISDDSFNGKHPNNINEGYTKIGIEIKPPTIGERYFLDSFFGFSTSPIIEIIDENTFKSTYSTYKIEYLKD